MVPAPASSLQRSPLSGEASSSAQQDACLRTRQVERRHRPGLHWGDLNQQRTAGGHWARARGRGLPPDADQPRPSSRARSHVIKQIVAYAQRRDEPLSTTLVAPRVVLSLPSLARLALVTAVRSENISSLARATVSKPAPPAPTTHPHPHAFLFAPRGARVTRAGGIGGQRQCHQAQRSDRYDQGAAAWH